MRRKQISFFVSICINNFFLIVTVIITQRFNVHFTWLVVRDSSSSVVRLREQRKLILLRFSLENILSSSAVETGTVSNNLIVNNASLLPTSGCHKSFMSGDKIQNFGKRKSLLGIFY